MKHPNPLMLLRIAQGDALGLAVEYAKFPRDQELKEKVLRFEHYYKHPTHSLQPGAYSDDTQMSVAVAEALIAEKSTPFLSVPTSVRYLASIQSSFAESFVRCFKRDPRDGYARGFQTFLEGVKDGRDFLDRINPVSDKNGAAMRAVPIGVLPTPELVYYVAGEQAKLTHHTSGGLGSAIIVALLSHFALYSDAPMSEAREFVRDFLKIPDSEESIAPWTGGPVQGPGVGIATARAVMTLVTTETSLLNIAKTAIEWGGDTDSVLAIAWGIASTRMREDLPSFFEDELEDGTYGLDFLRDLGAELMRAYSE